jgi:SAM-dependent methyltransferase
MNPVRGDKPAWLIDELAYAGPEHLDEDFVQSFDRKQRFDPTPDVDKLRSLGLGEASTLLDFGAGTGAMALAAAPFCKRVVAIDVSPVMLDVLRAKAERAGLKNVEAVREGMLTFDHHGETAGFAVSRNALHSLPDFWKALALQRIAAALKPGGVLLLRDLVYSFEPADSERVLEAWFAAAPAQRPEDGYTREEYETHVRSEFSAFSWLLEPMLSHSGFDITDTWYSDSRTFAAYTCVKR